MDSPTLIVGPNFSGRSRALVEALKVEGKGGHCFYVGPYAESGLSGVATTVAEELAFYGFRGSGTYDAGLTAATLADTILARQSQRVATLSGGEQTLLALVCFDSSRHRVIGVDTALEQLDPTNRASALRHLSSLGSSERGCWLIDNRDPARTVDAKVITLKSSGAFPLDLDPLVEACPTGVAPVIEMRSIGFSYPAAPPVFGDVSLKLRGTGAYRLYGPNGSGKTTFLKLLAGAVPPSAGAIYLDGKLYDPHRFGNEVLAWAMQDPDHQWVSTSVEDDLALKTKAFIGRRYARRGEGLEMGNRTACLGIPNAGRHHLLDLPKALRKRLSWLWPLSGVLPWAAMDEPTLGQDRAAAHKLADTLKRLLGLGMGLLFVTHDEDFAKLIPHETVVFGNRTVLTGNPSAESVPAGEDSTRRAVIPRCTPP
jgi:energy-coupling factor transporter ATP-binding protein EcfA2